MHCFSKKSVIKPGDFMIITTKKLTLTAILCGLLTASVLAAGCAFPASNLNTAAPSGSAEGPETDYTVAVNYTETEETDEQKEDMDFTVMEEENEEPSGIDPELDAALMERLDVQLIPVNEYSRPGDPLTEVNAVVVHYLGNPGTTGQENRDYFASLAETGEEYASPHFVIGLEGEIIQLVPLDEISYCSNDRNYDTVAVECCHPDESGVFTDATYDSLVLLTAWLCQKFDLEYTDIIRHYDVTGKICPRAFVENPDYYYAFKADVANTMGIEITADEIAASSDDTFMDPEEVERYFAEESDGSGWRHGPGGGPRGDFGPPDHWDD